MRRIGLTVLSLCFWLCQNGCMDYLGKQVSDPAAEKSSPRTNIREPESELAAQKRNNAILTSRVNELVKREQELSKLINDLRLDNRQQKIQLETLRTAPAERDAYRKRAEDLAAEVTRLKKKIAELEQTIERLRQAAERLPAEAKAEPPDQ
ncbi:MAG: hypothetical protein ACYTF6_13995 [Planctomycetota bacterium]|jgi:chromosome segregation ATPase